MSGGEVNGGGRLTRPLAGLVAAVVLAVPAQLAGQQLGSIRGYSLTVPTASGSGDLSDGGLALLQQLRFMGRPTWGLVALEIAYQQNLQLRENVAAGLSGTVFVPTSTKWLPLQWNIVDDDHVTWDHAFDRLALEAGGRDWDGTVGRQAISWATTLFLTPADPFAPFDPSDPFRVYRAGVDAARARYYPGPLSEIDMVVRLADTDSGTAVTALARGKTTWGETDVSAWAGLVFDRPGVALAATRSVGGLQLRGEISLREDPDSGAAAVRLAVGVDNRFDVGGRDLYVVVEYQHDDFGASDADDLTRVFRSEPCKNGEMQVLGEDEVAAQGSWQIHPLWNVSLLTLINLRDGSGLVVPAGTYSVGTDVTVAGGLFFSYGDGSISLLSGSVGSEYGIVPVTGYLSATWFF
jgi:hypothetical protein